MKPEEPMVIKYGDAKINVVTVEGEEYDLIYKDLKKAMADAKQSYVTFTVSLDKYSEALGKLVSWSADLPSSQLPGEGEQVIHPVYGYTTGLHSTIMDLNDCHEWTREQIADWLETLDVDLRFNAPEE